MKSWKYWLYQPYKFIIVLPVFAVNTLVVATITSVLACFSRRLAFKPGIAWAKLMQWVVPMRVRVRGRENVVPGSSYVVVANHQSAFDIFVIYGSLGLDFRWIMKKELRKAPLIGFACERLQHIFIDRSSARASYRSIQRAKEILVGGTSVVIFPEGTRSASANMAPFKHGAFKMAFELGLPILPVTIKDTYKIMGKSIKTLMPGNVELVMHKPIDTMQYEGRRDELIQVVRDSMASAL